MAILVDVLRAWTIFALAGVSLVLVFKATGVFNLALGALMLLDTYLLHALTTRLDDPLLAFGLVLLLQVPFGLLAYVIIARLISRQQLWAATVVTLGAALVVEALISKAWSFETLPVPSPVSGEFVPLPGGTQVSVVDLVAFLICVALLVALVIGLRATRVGLTLRATGESPLLASQVGVSVRTIFAAAWVVGLMCAFLAAAVYGYRSGTNPGAVAIGLGAIAPAMIGGLDSLGGVFVGALVAALGQQLALRYVGGGVSEFTLFAMVLVVLVVRPYGLFGSTRLERA